MAPIRIGIGLLFLAAAVRAQDPSHTDWIHEPARVRQIVHQLPQHRKGTVLLSERSLSGFGTGAGARAARIIRELGGAEREVAKEMKGHTQELTQVEGLLHQASELSLRAGQMGVSAHHSHAALLQSENKVKAHAKEGMRVATGAAAEARALSGFLKEDAKLARADGKLYQEAVAAKAAASSGLTGKQQSEVLQLLNTVQSAQRKVISSELSELKATKAEVRQLQGHRAGARSVEKTQVKAKAATQLAMEAAMHEATFASGEAKLAREGHRIENEMKTAKGEIAQALDKKDAKAAAEVEGLLSQALHMQDNVVRAELHGAKEAQARAKQLAGPLRAHRAALLQRSDASASFAASLERRRSQLQAEASKRVRMLRESKRLLSKTSRAKAAALQDLKKAGASSTKLEEIEQLMGEAEGAARRVSADERKEVALTKGEIRSAAALSKKYR